MNETFENVKMLFEKYGNKIKNERHLILLFWRDVDKLNISKEFIPTSEFLEKSTCSSKIIQAKNAYEILNEESE